MAAIGWFEITAPPNISDMWLLK